jgi:signal transduction histidine kinase
MLDSDLVALDALVGSRLPRWSPTGLPRKARLDIVVEEARRGLYKPEAVSFDFEVGTMEVFAPSRVPALCLRALLKNALEASTQGVVAVSARAEDGRVIVAVRDDGPGFSTEARERAAIGGFTTKPRRSGFGICMATRLAHAARGDLRILDGSPTRVELTLPVPPSDGA